MALASLSRRQLFSRMQAGACAPRRLRAQYVRCQATAADNGGGNALLTPYKLGPFQLKHRIVYAPLTRCRAFDNLPQQKAAVYYGQRTTDGGLLISEATAISPQAHGYPFVPGVYTPEQVEAWKPVTRAVKDKGGIFFCQLWHVGRQSHPDYQPEGALPVAPSAIAVRDGTKAFSPKTFTEVEYPVPRPLEASEIPGIVAQYAAAARNALAAGFEGVEIHSANGYLVDQFLKSGSNTRTDDYGGSIEKRARFALEVVDAVVAAAGAERVGLRLSPFGRFGDVVDDHPYATTIYLLEELNRRGLAYVHLVEPRAGGNDDVPDTTDTLAPFRALYGGTLIAAGGYDRALGIEAIEGGAADLIAYGRHFLANPDFVRRIELNAPFNKYDRNTFYSQGDEGYIDYPFLEETDYGKKLVGTA